MEKETKYYIDVVFNKESLSDGSPVYVAQCTNLGIASQGSTIEEAKKNIKEAVELYLEEMPEKYHELDMSNEPSFFSIIEIRKNAKIADNIR